MLIEEMILLEMPVEKGSKKEKQNLITEAQSLLAQEKKAAEWILKEKTRIDELMIEIQKSQDELKKDGADIQTQKIKLETEQKKNDLEKERILSEKERFRVEKEQFHNDMRSLSGGVEADRKKLEQESRFFAQKMQILQSGFLQLDADRRKFQKEKDKFDAKKEVYHDNQSYYQHMEVSSVLFCGVNSYLTLKKRYKDLIKMFHPDNVAGDREMVQILNREYEELKKAYEIGKQA